MHNNFFYVKVLSIQILIDFIVIRLFELCLTRIVQVYMPSNIEQVYIILKLELKVKFMIN